MKMTVLFAFASAALFGLSTPAAKILLGSVHPAMLAGLLYCGAGLGVAALRLLRAGRSGTRDVALGRRDVPWLVGAVLSGGVIGPLLLMIGLTGTEAATASLLLTFEGAATALIAWLFFRESYGLRLVLGMACLVSGAAALAWSGPPILSAMTGPLAIVGACFAWSLDNNFTRKISLADPLQIVEIKGLVAGPVNLALGLWAGGSLPPLTTSLLAASIGFVGYGLSLVLFVLALRELGAARTSAYFATAPFLGTLGAVVALGDPVTVQLAGAGVLMAAGVWLHLTERHAHEHVHTAIGHSHPHVHDVHHQHAHAHEPSTTPGETHTHAHHHELLTHAHPHTPDPHHDHGHA
ncbi:MAG TPA: EamA family transporter [Xanthobacteraceae bacterium]|nr:EamA family transporter [Xanthobacteraceae bacterium]